MRCMTAFLIVFCILLEANFCFCDKKADSAKHFKAGVTLLKAEDFEAAALEFEESVRIYPTQTVFFNLANCYKALHRYTDVLETIETIRDTYGNQITPEIQTVLKQMEQETKLLLGTITIWVNVDGARISLDNKPLGSSPLQADLPINPGKHFVEITADGYDTQTRNFSILSQKNKTLRIELQQSVKQLDAAPITPMQLTTQKTNINPKNNKRAIVVGSLLTGFGTAAMATGFVIGGIAYSKNKQLVEDCSGDNICTTAEEQDNADRYSNMAVATNFLVGIGAVSAVAGVITLIVAKKKNKKHRNISLSPTMGPSSASIAISKVF